jgi:hypothetical protein
MKTILAKSDFTLNMQGQFISFKANQKYEVSDEEADNWWTKAHSTVISQTGSPSPQSSAQAREPVRGALGAPFTPHRGAPPFAVEAKPMADPGSPPAPVQSRPAPVKKPTK